MNRSFALFTDASLNPQHKFGIGGYLLIPSSTLELSPQAIPINKLSNQIMIQKFESISSTQLELEVALWALENCYHRLENCAFILFSDSQCIANLLQRRQKLEANNFISKRTSHPLKNAPFYQKFYQVYDDLNFSITKLSGHLPIHQQDTPQKVFATLDKSIRKELRQQIKKYENK